METEPDAEWVDSPWWLDTVAESDVVECPEQWATMRDLGPMSVQETSLAADAVDPGPEALRLLVSLRGQVVSDDEKLTAVQLWQRQLAWAAGAEQSAVLDLVGQQPHGDPHAELQDSFKPLELAAALNTTVDQARAKIANARLMAGQLAATGAMLRSGELDPYRVWLMTKTLLTLAPEAAAQVEAEILPVAGSLTGAQLGKALTKAARKADPEWGTRMFANSRRSRRVGFDSRGQDGLVLLYAYLPPVEAVAMQQHLEAAARLPSPDPDDERCHDERMADALVASVLGSQPGDPTTPLSPNVEIKVLAPLPTLLGLREDTGELAGYGEIPAGMARELSADAKWRRWVTDPVDGHLLDYGTRLYRPPKRLANLIRAMDRYCRFPGSGRSAKAADLDHPIPFGTPGGTTSPHNLGALSRFVHRAKTHGDYQLRRDPDGTCTWTTPLGRVYGTSPQDYRPDSDR
jgi:hypothetical protein